MKQDELQITARLAQLALREEETESLEKGVKQMLEYFRMMEEIDVSELEPTTHALLKHNRTREDAAVVSETPDALLEQAPEQEDRYITIPNVL
jgi:aspartyl-tRNA(Asn)/glutamyl-tRNA(Gln) amidotransferase subunit C